MKLVELINEARTRLMDPDTPDALWKNQDLVEYANWAEREACRRAHLLFDETEEGVASYTVAGGQAWVPLSRLVLFVDKAKWEGVPIYPHLYNVLQVAFPGWEAQVTGTPSLYVLNNGNIGLFPVPDEEGGSLTLRVSRLPLADMRWAEKETVSPEIGEQYHDLLVDGIMAQAYLKKDSQTFDAEGAQRHAALFERAFGPPVSAREENYQRNFVNEADRILTFRAAAPAAEG
jgi:hypothetical protein